MSFLRPLIRHTARQGLRRSPSYLPCQRIPQIQRLLVPSVAARFYSEKTPRSSKDSSEPSKPVNPEDESTSTSSAPSSEQPSTPQSDTSKDPFNQDMLATPGSILSQYTVAEEPTSLETTESATGRKKEEYISSADRKRDRMAKVFTWGFFAGLVGVGVYLGRPLDDEERSREDWGDLPQGHSPLAYWKRFQNRFRYMLAYYNEPAFPKMLPDQLPEPYGRPYTLLLDLDDFLIHSEWTREHGWRTAKRPGLDYFLGYLAQFYEVVIFTDQYIALAGPVVQKLDPYHTALSGALFRDATRYIDGKPIKDLSYLNRDLSKVIAVDTNPESVKLQPDNAIIVPKWKGDPKDKDLIALIPFLEYLASQNFNDFRPILKEYKEAAEKHHLTIADEFARREALAREALQKTLRPSTSPTGPSFVSRLFGLRALPPVHGTADTSEEIVTPLDMMRKQATEGYEAMRKYIDEHAQEILEEDKKREQQFQAEQKVSLMSRLGTFPFNASLFGKPPESTDKEQSGEQQEGERK